MRQLLLNFLVVHACFITSIFSQVIDLDTTTIVVNGEVGDTSIIHIDITNNGTEVLDWTLLTEGPRFVSEPIFFSKSNFANPQLEINQDRITDNIFITRGDVQGPFNAATETVFERDISPFGTLWALGSTLTLDSSSYGNWATTACPSCVDDFSSFENIYSLYLPESNRFFDVKLLSFVGQNSGGGISYERSEILPVLGQDVSAGFLEPGETKIVEIRADLSLFRAGIFDGRINISSNSISNSEIEIPILIEVNGGTPEISFSDTLIVIPRTVVGRNSDSVQFEVFNGGTGFLEITDIILSSDGFSISPSSLSIAPLERAALKVSFTATVTGTFNSKVVINSNLEEPKCIYSEINIVDDITLNRPLNNVLINEGFDSLNINLQDVFVDFDGQSLMFDAVLDNTDIISVFINETTLVLREISKGTSLIRINASDSEGNSSSTSFEVRINGIPTISRNLDDIVVNEGFNSTSIDVLNLFEDFEKDSLTFSITSEFPGVVVADFVDNKIVFTEVGVGESIITITADDGFGGVVTEEFNFEIESLILSGSDVAVSSFSIYPNPAEDCIIIQNPGTEFQTLWRLLDLTGLTLKNGELSPNSNKINISELSEGIYYLVISSSTKSAKSKIIVTN